MVFLFALLACSSVFGLCPYTEENVDRYYIGPIDALEVRGGSFFYYSYDNMWDRDCEGIYLRKIRASSDGIYFLSQDIRNISICPLPQIVFPSPDVFDDSYQPIEGCPRW